MNPKPTLDGMMSAYALDTVYFAKDKFNVDLDFSETSIKQVEEILSKLHDSLPKNFIQKVFKK